MKPEEVHQMLTHHVAYWDYMRHDMLKYKALYESKFWDDRQDDPTAITIQTQDCFAYVESYIGSLYARNPAIILKKGLRGTGNVDKAAAVANEFLSHARQQIEDASRMAIIYPNAWFKLVPQKTDDVYDKLLPMALAPWEIIVDRDAPRADRQRFVGHVYYMPLYEAKEKFGSKKFNATDREPYFSPRSGTPPGEEYTPRDTQFDKYIQIVEMYDLVNDKLQFWSTNWSDGNKFLESVPIPFRDYADRPVTPLIPFFFTKMPDQPMTGYSGVKRIYDQCYEKNVVRSFQAGAIRKASRQYIVRKGVFDEEQMAQITSGIDGLFVEIDDEDLDGAIRPVPHTPLSPEVGLYAQMVTQDKNDADMQAPFTRGEAEGVTATEIAALASYSSTQLGSMARKRDEAIEALVKSYLCILGLFLEEERPASIMIDGLPTIVTPDDVIADFDVFAADQAATPMSEQLAKQQLLQNIPVLTSLGVPPQELLKEVVRILGLPESFMVEVPVGPESPGGRAGAIESEPSLEQMIANPSVKNIQTALPGEF